MNQLATNLLPVLGNLSAAAAATQLRRRPRSKKQYLRFTFRRCDATTLSPVQDLVAQGCAFRVRTGRVRYDYDGAAWSTSTSRGPVKVVGAMYVEVALD